MACNMNNSMSSGMNNMCQNTSCSANRNEKNCDNANRNVNRGMNRNNNHGVNNGMVRGNGFGMNNGMGRNNGFGMNNGMGRNNGCGMNNGMGRNNGCEMNNRMTGSNGCGTNRNNMSGKNDSEGLCSCRESQARGNNGGCIINIAPVDSMAPGMSYVPWQKWQDVYDMEKGCARGTIFGQLDKPYIGRGCK